MTHPVVPTRGSILYLTPAAGVVRFRTKGDEQWSKPWSEPLIGWAVVVSHVVVGGIFPSQDADGEAAVEYETEVEAVVLEDNQHASTVGAYLASRSPGVAYSIELGAVGD